MLIAKKRAEMSASKHTGKLNILTSRVYPVKSDERKPSLQAKKYPLILTRRVKKVCMPSIHFIPLD